MARKDHSPLLYGCADFSVFNESVQQTAEDMLGEIMAAMAEWEKGFQDMGIGDSLRQLADARLSALRLDMQTSGLKLITDRVDEVKAADNLWRLQHKDVAARELLGD